MPWVDFYAHGVVGCWILGGYELLLGLGITERYKIEEENLISVVVMRYWGKVYNHDPEMR